MELGQARSRFAQFVRDAPLNVTVSHAGGASHHSKWKAPRLRGEVDGRSEEGNIGYQMLTGLDLPTWNRIWLLSRSHVGPVVLRDKWVMVFGFDLAPDSWIVGNQTHG
jgi:hypothetical protein